MHSVVFMQLCLFVASSVGHKLYIDTGTEPRPHSYPWQLYLKHGPSAFCAASLLESPCMVGKSNIVITAAHCIPGALTGSTKKRCRFAGITVLAGEHSLKIKEKGEDRVNAVNGVCHEDYCSVSLSSDFKPANDMAIIKLKRPIYFSETIKPIALPKDDVALGTTCKISGWGYTDSSGTRTSVLHELNVEIANASVCTEKLYYDHEIMICAARGPFNAEGTEGTACNGDSGGALVCDEDGHPVISGVFSGANWLCGGPSIYTRVHHYLPWIGEQIRKLGICPVL